MENVSKQQQIIDFFHLKGPKPLSVELKIKFVVFLTIYYPLTKVLLNDGFLALFALAVILFLTYLFYLKPRQDKQSRYDNRVAPDVLNNWLLESCKTKILERAIDYLEIETKNMKPEQFIVIPYPVFHKTKNIKDEFILREKTEILPDKQAKGSEETPDVYYNYSYWNIQVLILSKSYISFYFCGYNWLRDEIINERSNEYFYQDVATVKTETNEVSFLSKWHEEPITEARITKIIHNSGDILNLITEIPDLKQPPKTIVDIEKIEKTIRMLLRHSRTIDESRKQVSINFKHEMPQREPIEL